MIGSIAARVKIPGGVTRSLGAAAAVGVEHTGRHDLLAPRAAVDLCGPGRERDPCAAMWPDSWSSSPRRCLREA